MKIVLYWFYYLTYLNHLKGTVLFEGISGESVKNFEKVLASPEISRDGSVGPVSRY